MGSRLTRLTKLTKSPRILPTVLAFFSILVLVLILGLGLGLGSVSVSASADDTTRKVGKVALTDSVRAALQTKVDTILKRNCATSGCHAGKYPEAKLSLDSPNLLRSTKNVPSREIRSFMRIDTRTPEKSYLLMKVQGDARIKGQRMPRGAPPLTKEEIKAIALWLESLSTLENAK